MTSAYPASNPPLQSSGIISQFLGRPCTMKLALPCDSRRCMHLDVVACRTSSATSSARLSLLPIDWKLFVRENARSVETREIQYVPVSTRSLIREHSVGTRRCTSRRRFTPYDRFAMKDQFCVSRMPRRIQSSAASIDESWRDCFAVSVDHFGSPPEPSP